MIELTTEDTEKHCKTLEDIGCPEELQIEMLERFVTTFEGGENATLY